MDASTPWVQVGQLALGPRRGHLARLTLHYCAKKIMSKIVHTLYCYTIFYYHARKMMSRIVHTLYYYAKKIMTI